eukprot:TRINITY_DN774_c0_g1_i4.p1 TRINITY_DN774_c0_g1~~TRINITY_DN774_c0_g1_i4.p1  ORF type:complete len:263 (+),score=46.52 TRINITY_DN774_c0_g1_i4:54-842(+)
MPFLPTTNTTGTVDTNCANEVEFELTNKVLGEGSYSKVVLAQNTKTKEFVAAKVVDLKATRKYYDREVNALSAIHSTSKNNNNIIPLIQHGEDEDSGYIFTPYFPSGTLHDYVSLKGGLQDLEALEILGQVIEGVHTIHSANFTHSDLKAENIMYDPETNKATLFDLGLSLEMDKDSSVRECCGSPLYMAPEVILRKKHNAVLSDIWSLGILFYYILFADFPWLDVEDMEDLVDAILNDVISFPRHVSKEIKALIGAMLEVK